MSAGMLRQSVRMETHSARRVFSGGWASSPTPTRCPPVSRSPYILFSADEPSKGSLSVADGVGSAADAGAGFFFRGLGAHAPPAHPPSSTTAGAAAATGATTVDIADSVCCTTDDITVRTRDNTSKGIKGLGKQGFLDGMNGAAGTHDKREWA